MDIRGAVQERSPLTLLLGGVLALSAVRVVGRFVGLALLLGVVGASVAALTVGILVLRLALLH